MSEPYGAGLPFREGSRSVIGKLETSSTGNLIIRVGSQNFPGGPWFQTEHVVLRPEEVDRFLTEIRNLWFVTTAPDVEQVGDIHGLEVDEKTAAEIRNLRDMALRNIDAALRDLSHPEFPEPDEDGGRTCRISGMIQVVIAGKPQQQSAFTDYLKSVRKES